MSQPIPGLEDTNFKQVIAGSNGPHQWLPSEKLRYFTIACIMQGDKILLGFKKKGFGAAKYNGFGGKVEAGETSAEAARRELEEEAGVRAPLIHAGTLLSVREGSGQWHYTDIYRTETYTGEITESDEMRPEWFVIPPELRSQYPNVEDQSRPISDNVALPGSIPFDKMWEADKLWLPLVLRKQFFIGRTDYVRSGDGVALKRWWFAVDSEK